MEDKGGMEAGLALLCLVAAVNAEREVGLPAGLLSAVAIVESGADPFAVRVGPDERRHRNAAAAADTVREALSQGVQPDIGCFQVNVGWHGGAFGSLDAALNPDVQARYAARYLKSLRSELGSWSAAVGAYHSRSPVLAARYQCRVAKVWTANGSMSCD